MAINFPNNPSVNDTFTVGGIQFTFTGVKWESGAVVEISSDTTPSLGGTLDAGTHNINNVGVITATTFSGNLIGNVTGTATTATYAQTAGIATNAQGLTGDPSIQVTNATVLGNLDVQGTTTTIDTAVTEVDSLQVDGNVGIGTTNATSILDVRNGIIVKDQDTSQNAANPGLQLKHTGSIYGSWRHDGRLEIGGQDANATITLNPNGTATFAGKVDVNNELHVHRASTTASNALLALHSDIGGTKTRKSTIRADGTAEFAGTVSDSIGPLRRLDIVSSSVDLTLSAASHAGRLIRMTSTNRTFTIPSGSFSSGDMITIFHVGTGNMTIAQGSSVTLYNAADGATGNRTLAAKGMVTIACTDGASNEFVISGSQLT